MRWEDLANASLGELIEEMIDQKLEIINLKSQRERLIGWEDAVCQCEQRINDLSEEINKREYR